VSQRAYARHRAQLGLSGTTHRAVQKALLGGRIKLNAEKLIDTAVADKAWADNTSEAHQRNLGQAAAAKAKASPGPTAAAAAPTDTVNLARASAIEKSFRAQLARLDVQERTGELVQAAEVKARWAQIVTISRNKILGIPHRIKDRIPDLTIDQVKAIQQLVEEALEDLANGVG
jgi:phage terminase Nu1 subunit (DNA packaging protein)